MNLVQNHANLYDYPLNIVHIGSILWFSFTKERIYDDAQIDASGMQYYKKLHRILLENGVYFAPSGYEVTFISAAHSLDDIHKTCTIINQALDEIFKS